MESFCWSKNFETGLPDVDKQHYQLVEIINKLGRLIVNDKISESEFGKLLKQLTSYALFHFYDEESRMKQQGIDPRHLASHIKNHKDFIQEVGYRANSAIYIDSESAQNLFEFLTYWLSYHVLGFDQNMARQLEDIQAGLTAQEAYDKEEREINQATEPLLVALNGLFAQVSKRNTMLLELNQSLEDKVSQRTKELHEANKHLEELSLTDALTGLPNRRHAMRSMVDLWKELEGIDSTITCMMIDVDHFKEINDNYGHDAGDKVLIELAKTLRDSLRTDDIACRLGGDEFLIICPYTDKVGGMHIAQDIHKAVSELQVTTGDGVWQGSISVGVATQIPSINRYEDLIKMADKRVYAAKLDGKNCVR